MERQNKQGIKLGKVERLKLSMGFSFSRFVFDLTLYWIHFCTSLLSQRKKQLQMKGFSATFKQGFYSQTCYKLKVMPKSTAHIYSVFISLQYFKKWNIDHLICQPCYSLSCFPNFYFACTVQLIPFVDFYSQDWI